MEEEYRELRAQHEALRLAFVGLVSLIDEGHEDVPGTLAAILEQTAERATIPLMASSLRDLSDSLTD